MQWGSWVVARARASATLLLALLALVAMTATIVALTGGLATWIATSAARATLENSPPGQSGIQLQARAGEDVAAQDAEARASLVAGFAPAAVDIWTTLVSEPVRTDGGRVVAWAGEHLQAHAEVVEGAWSRTPHEVALHVGAADELDLGPGDTLTLGEQVVTITSLWRPADPADPRWHGDGLALNGVDGQLLGPVLVHPDLVQQLSGTPYLRWGLAPDLEEAAGQQFDALAVGAEQAKRLVEEADVTGRGVTMTGSLAGTVRSAERDWAVARTLSLVPLAVLAVVAVVAVVQVARVLTSVRDREARFLVARGATTGQLLAMSLLEALAVVTLAAALGSCAAVVALRLVSGSWAPARESFTGGAAAGVLAFLVVALVAWVHLRRVTADPFLGRRGVGLAATGVVGLLLVGAAAVVTTSQLTGFAADGDARLATLPVLAPAALLALAGLLGTAALAPLARLIETLSRRISRGVTGWLAAAHLSRNLALVAVPVVLTTLSVGALTLAGLYAGSSTTLSSTLAHLERGADVRATLDPPMAATTSVPELPDVAGVSGVDAVAPVWIDRNATLGDVSLDLVSTPVAGLHDVASLPPSIALPVADLGLADRLGGIPIPPGAGSLEIKLDGALVLDPWQRARLELLPELHRLESEAPWIVGDKEQAALDLTNEALDDYTPSVSVRAAVVLREPATGIVHVVTGPELSIPGPVPTRDQGTGAVTVAPTSASLETSVGLPTGLELVVDGVGLQRTGRGTTPPRLSIGLQLAANGTPLGEPGWASDAALRSDLAVAYLEQRDATEVRVSVTQPDGRPMPVIESNRPATPPILTADEGGWRLEGDQTDLRDVRIGPNLDYVGDDPLHVAPGPTPPSRVPLALTPAAAEAALLGLGDDLELIAFQRRIPATLAALTPAVPGTSDPRAALIDSAALGDVLSSQGLAPPWPTELWLAGSDIEARDVAALPGVNDVAVPIDRPDTVALSQSTFWMGAAGALLLALAGAAATFVAQLTARRGEVDVLRRLGVAGRSQAWSRLMEHALGLALSTIAGILAGLLVGRVVVPPLVRAAIGTPRDTAVPLHLDAVPVAVLLVAWGLAVAVLLVVVARAAAAQARHPADREVDQ